MLSAWLGIIEGISRVVQLIFTRADALANLGTILGGGLVLATRSALPDLIVGAAISMVVLYGSFEIIRDAALEPSKAGAKQT